MKILVISDEIDPLVYSENIKSRFADVELVLSCGDLPFNYYDYIVSSLNVPLFYVNGNHVQVVNNNKTDNPFGDHTSGFVNLDNRVVEYKGLLFAGLEGSLRYNRNPHVCQYSNMQMKKKIARTLPRLWVNKLRYGRKVDVLLTHAPPLGINDQPDRCHTGFKPFLSYMRKHKPRFLLHGHVHLYDRNKERSKQFMKTEIMNCFGSVVIDI